MFSSSIHARRSDIGYCSSIYCLQCSELIFTGHSHDFGNYGRVTHVHQILRFVPSEISTEPTKSAETEKENPPLTASLRPFVGPELLP